MFDIAIKDGLILDGLGNPGFLGDVGIKGKRIQLVAAQGEQGGLSGQRVIQAKGLAVAPGFIDIHNHFDTMLVVNPAEDGEIRQGVTTGCIGNCGISLAPVKREFFPILQRYTSPLNVGSPLPWDWETTGQYLDRIGKPCMNVAALVGHGTVRIAVMGMDNRRPTAREMDQMKNMILEAMDQGARGLSSGLIYPPGIFAETDELVELCKTVANQGGIYATHIRGESDTLLEAVREAIEIGEESSASLLISHHKAGGRKNWGKVKESLKLVEEARERGIDVHLDQYPYTAGSTMLAAILPPWMQEGKVGAVEQLEDPEVRHRVKEDLKRGIDGWENFLEITGWEGIVLASCKKEKELEGKSILQIAEERQQEPAETAFDILREEEGDVIAVIHGMCEEDVRMVMKHPLVMFATDGIPSPGKPHPRVYGTYPRILGKYVREAGVLSLEEAIRKMTSLPAQKLGLKDRGTIARKNKADLVVFNPSTVKEKSTYLEPHQAPEGIEYVLVNGTVAIEKGRLVNAEGGEILKR